MKMLCYVPAIMLFVLAGCGSGGDNGQVACEILVGCGDTTQAQCDQEWGVLELTNDCVSAMGAVDCKEHSSASPSYIRTCFPACSGTSYECRGGNVMICAAGMMMIARCVAVCQTKGGTYTGTCGVSYQGQTMPHAVCWCEVKQ